MPSSTDQYPSQSAPRNDNKLEDELRQVFYRFDANDDGKISALELRSYFGSFGEYMSHEQAKANKKVSTTGEDHYLSIGSYE